MYKLTIIVLLAVTLEYYGINHYTISILTHWTIYPLYWLAKVIEYTVKGVIEVYKEK